MDRATSEIQLKKLFQIDRFYDEQWETIQKILQGERVLLINKTGFGKSLCFQFPAAVMEGTAIVFTPLIALMRDQVKRLKRLGISANAIHSEQSEEVNNRVLELAMRGRTKILYISPERQESKAWNRVVKNLKISLVVIDEAHCISTWGHDFRPAFKNIVKLVNLLPAKVPLLATTATAPLKVEQDIAAQIKGKFHIQRGSLIRSNLALHVIEVKTEEEKMQWLGKNLEKLEGTGILYTGTRADAETYARWLQYLKIPAISYHAGLSQASRIEIEEGLLENRWKCVVSTNALGMGMDKPDIRFIIHTQIPQSPIHYYQEIGRAGRDNKPAIVILFFQPDDRKLPEYFIKNSKPSVSKYEIVMALIKNGPIGERAIMKAAKLNQHQFRNIKTDLLAQGIIKEAVEKGHIKYIPVQKAPPLQTENFEAVRQTQLQDLENMIDYVYTTGSRMQYLCSFLNDPSTENLSNCDNTSLNPFPIHNDELWTQRLEEFRESHYPVLKHKSNYLRLEDGVAASYYEVTSVRKAIEKSKYETFEDFPDFLVNMVLKAYRKKYRKETFDLILYVPPTVSGDQVKNFSEKIANALRIPLSHDLTRTPLSPGKQKEKDTFSRINEQALTFTYKNPETLKGKNILLIDDISNSGRTINEIGKLLTKEGAYKISPLVIAKVNKPY